MSQTKIENTLKERGSRYGTFKQNADIAQTLKDILRGYEGWNRLAADQKEALDMVASKISRILTGDPEYIDNWHDISGYTTLVENAIVSSSLVGGIKEAQNKQGPSDNRLLDPRIYSYFTQKDETI